MTDAEDEEWPLEGPLVEKSVRSALECPVCLELMAPPITMCENGHNICRDCRPRLSSCPTCRQPLLGTRNVALENLARDLHLPVRTSQPDASCPRCYDNIYGCPMECSWTGNRSDIKPHMQETHSDKVLEGTNDIKCSWNLPLIVRDTRVISAFGEVFRYTQRLHTIKDIFYITVQYRYIGPRGEASKYKYEVELCGNSGDRRVLITGNTTLENHQNIGLAYEEKVKNVAQGKLLVYTVRLFKVIFAFGEVFRYTQRLHTIKEIFYITVQYIGPRGEASKFKYEVELCGNSGDRRVLITGNTTLENHQNIGLAYEDGNCITLDYDVVKNVAQGKLLVYTVRLFKSATS